MRDSVRGALSGGNERIAQEIVYFGSGALALGGRKSRSVTAVVNAARAGDVLALVIDARSVHDGFRAKELLRALFDDPRRPQRVIHPHRVLALIATGDVEAAFAFGRYGIAGAIEERSLGEIERHLRRAVESDPDPQLRSTPLLSPPRSTRLTHRLDHELPTVTLAYRHAPETLAALARYVRALRDQAHETTVFADVATIIDTMVSEDITCRTNLATKAGATHGGQFIGSFEFYRELRRTRYGRIPDHPGGAIDMDVFIAVDEVLHETIHLLFLANQLRAGIPCRHFRIAEEFSATWWQAVVHHRVFPEWLADRHILEINDDFMFSERQQESREGWQIGNVFDPYAEYPWIPFVLARLPERPSYVGRRPDLAALIASFAGRPEAAFLVPNAEERLDVPIDFDAYPPIPEALGVGPPGS